MTGSGSAPAGARGVLTLNGVSEDATQRELHILFSSCPGYVQCCLGPADEDEGGEKPTAVVYFKTVEEARKAASSRTGTTWTQGESPVVFDPSRLEVQEAPVDHTAGLEVLELGFDVTRMTSGRIFVKGVEAELWAHTCGFEVGDEILQLSAEGGGDVTAASEAGAVEEVLKQRPLTVRRKGGTAQKPVGPGPSAGRLLSENCSPMSPVMTALRFNEQSEAETTASPCSPDRLKGIYGSKRARGFLRIIPAHMRLKAAIAARSQGDLDEAIVDVRALNVPMAELKTAEELLQQLRRHELTEKAFRMVGRATTVIRDAEVLSTRHDVSPEQKRAAHDTAIQVAEDVIGLCREAGLGDARARIAKDLKAMRESRRNQARGQLFKALAKFDLGPIRHAVALAEAAGMRDSEATEMDEAALAHGYEVIRTIEEFQAAEEKVQDALQQRDLKLLRKAITLGQAKGVDATLLEEAKEMLMVMEAQAEARWMLFGGALLCGHVNSTIFTSRSKVLSDFKQIVDICGQHYLTASCLEPAVRWIKKMHMPRRLKEAIFAENVALIEELVPEAQDLLGQHPAIDSAHERLGAIKQRHVVREKLHELLRSPSTLEKIPLALEHAAEFGMSEEEMMKFRRLAAAAKALGELEEAMKQRDVEKIQTCIQECKSVGGVDQRRIDAALEVIRQEDVLASMDQAIADKNLQGMREALEVWKQEEWDPDVMRDAEESLKELEGELLRTTRASVVHRNAKDILTDLTGNPILFEKKPGPPVIDAESQKTLGDIVQKLKESFPKLVLDIQGFCNSKERANMISKERVQRVQKVFEKAGCTNRIAVRSDKNDGVKNHVSITPRWHEDLAVDMGITSSGGSVTSPTGSSAGKKLLVYRAGLKDALAPQAKTKAKAAMGKATAKAKPIAAKPKPKPKITAKAAPARTAATTLKPKPASAAPKARAAAAKPKPKPTPKAAPKAAPKAKR